MSDQVVPKNHRQSAQHHPNLSSPGRNQRLHRGLAFFYRAPHVNERYTTNAQLSSKGYIDDVYTTSASGGSCCSGTAKKVCQEDKRGGTTYGGRWRRWRGRGRGTMTLRIKAVPRSRKGRRGGGMLIANDTLLASRLP